MPKISIIVPIYNVEKYLDKCVNSILSQTFSDFELILVDDGSPDNCGRMCDDWAQKDSRIVVCHKQNGGLSDARNYGIDRATGEYLTFIDSDDYIKETYLEYLYSLFSECDDCKVTACNHFVVRNDSAAPDKAFEGVRVLNRKEAYEEALYHGILDVSAWGKLYKKEVFETLRYPVGRLYEDTYVIGEVIALTENIVCGSAPQYYYIQRDNSIVNGGFKEKNLEFIESVDKLCGEALSFDKGFAQAVVRRKTHAALSVLRYMENCENKWFSKRNELRKTVLQNADEVLGNPKTPKRDKIAIYTLKLGLKPFYLAWKLYGKIR